MTERGPVESRPVSRENVAPILQNGDAKPSHNGVKRKPGRPITHTEPIPAPADWFYAEKSELTDGNGNGHAHVEVENVAAEIPHRPFVPGNIEQALHRRVDRGFLDYASYVIRDRAIPNLADGLKPVQRRILWALHETDDGRFMKVANIVGETMKYHPHGDASIGDALVVLAEG